MPWNLTEEEQDAVMKAVKKVLDPHLVRATGSFTITWENRDGTTEPLEVPHTGFVISDDAPSEIRALNDAYLDVIAKGAFVGSAFREACEDCDGTGERILNPDWPSGTKPHREACATCSGTGDRSE